MNDNVRKPPPNRLMVMDYKLYLGHVNTAILQRYNGNISLALEKKSMPQDIINVARRVI